VEMLTRPPPCLRLFQQPRGTDSGDWKQAEFVIGDASSLSAGHPSSSPDCRQTSDHPVSTLHRSVPHGRPLSMRRLDARCAHTHARTGSEKGCPCCHLHPLHPLHPRGTRIQDVSISRIWKQHRIFMISARVPVAGIVRIGSVFEQRKTGKRTGGQGVERTMTFRQDPPVVGIMPSCDQTCPMCPERRIDISRTFSAFPDFPRGNYPSVKVTRGTVGKIASRASGVSRNAERN